MDRKVILVLVDGLGYETSVHFCGYMEGLVHHGSARRWRMTTALPSMSRPLYETVFTGLTTHEHGVTANNVVRVSRCEHVFGLARGAGRRTAAAAFAWFSEFYNHAPWDPFIDAETDDDEKAIQHGRFYSQEGYPDRDLFARAASLAHRFAPDFLLVHPMGCDHIGHVHGADSPEYRTQATRMDTLLAEHLPLWRERGYRILVTSDHGMNADGYHGGTRDDVRHVAFYDVGSPEPGEAAEEASQLSVAPTILSLMGLEVPDAMKSPALG